ncbi:MAG TPA: hypothetical protein VFH60_00390, partial [Chloroflexia bacterium]|nr:hypothetical protein [Chloroflexia bacterium]
MRVTLRPRTAAWVLCVLLLASGTAQNNPLSYAQTSSRHFPQTGYTVQGRFLEYWQQNGGLAQQGYPISSELREVSTVDGKVYTVQYFERAVFEHHPENQPPYDVLLSLLGVFEYERKYPQGAPGEVPNNSPDSVLFPQTGKRLGGRFLGYWQTHGALAQQGYPISNEFTEQSDLNGKTYTVQYFERAVFESHPENAGTPYEVLLSQLGTFHFRDMYLYPPPVRPLPLNRVQRNPMLSTEYLVWNEATRPPGGHDPVSGTGEIWAMDLKTGKQFSVSNDAPGDQWVQAISGSTIVWTDNSHTSSIYEFDVMAKDLATGATYTVASGPTDQVQPVINGDVVAWVESAGNTQRLLVKELTDDRIIGIASARLDTGMTIQNPKLSEDYLVWGEIFNTGAFYPPKESYLKALNRKTGAAKVVATFRTGDRVGYPPQYSLADHRLVVTPFSGLDAKTTIYDQDTGQSAPIKTEGFPDSPALLSTAISGDTLVWAGGPEIWGVNLNDGKAVPLVAARGDQELPAVAGDWLAWTNRSGPNDGLIGLTSLSGSFATAEARRGLVTVFDAEAARRPVQYSSIDMVSPDEGWAVGNFGLLSHYMNGTWERVETNDMAPWHDVNMVSRDEGWAGTTAGLMRYDGTNWVPVRDPAIPDVTIFGIDMLSPDEGWAVGAGAILHYKDGRWQREPMPGADPTTDLLFDLDMVSPDEGWAVGNYSVIWHYSGGKWTQYNEPTDSSLESLYMFSAEEGWAAGTTGAILHYTN